MNLWAKSTVRQLVMLTVALFFFSCEDETSNLGFKNPNQKFNVSYIEIPVKSSVLLLDSIRTSNYNFNGETTRFLVGKYADDKFGNVSAAFFTQYFTTSITKLAANAMFDSVALVLRFDLYNYGSTAESPQQISVYELEQELKSEDKKYYNSSTDILVDPTPIGSASFKINPEKFKNINPQKDTVITVRVPLQKAFGQKIFDSALRWRDVATTSDSVFKMPSEFVKVFKGIAVKSGGGDKIVGFNPIATSGIILHYHADTTKRELALSFSNNGERVGFSQIKADRAGTELSGVILPHTDYLETSEKRYLQSSTGVFTKLDFSDFFKLDSIDNLIINSAELVIEDVESSLDPPSALALRILEDNNQMKIFSQKRESDKTDVNLFEGLLRYDFSNISQPATIANDSAMFMVNDFGRADITYSSETKSYEGSAALFLQQLFDKTENKTRYHKFILYPLSPSGAKSVHRAVFPTNKIKLKIKYTRPTIKP